MGVIKLSLKRDFLSKNNIELWKFGWELAANKTRDSVLEFLSNIKFYDEMRTKLPRRAPEKMGYYVRIIYLLRSNHFSLLFHRV